MQASGPSQGNTAHARQRKRSASLPPLIPSSRAVNIRSVQTAGSAQAHRARMSPACLAVAGTPAGSFSVCPFVTSPPSCAPFAPGPLRPFLATMGALTPVRPALRPCGLNTVSCGGQVSLIHVSGLPVPPSPPTHPVSLSLYHATPQLSELPALAGLGFTFGSQAGHTVGPYRVRYPTDEPFAFSCSSPRLSATQLLSATGRRASTWGGLAPPCPDTLSGARPRPSPG